MKAPFYIRMGPTEIRDGELWLTFTIPKWGIPFLIADCAKDSLLRWIRRIMEAIG